MKKNNIQSKKKRQEKKDLLFPQIRTFFVLVLLELNKRILNQLWWNLVVLTPKKRQPVMTNRGRTWIKVAPSFSRMNNNNFLRVALVFDWKRSRVPNLESLSHREQKSAAAENLDQKGASGLFKRGPRRPSYYVLPFFYVLLYFSDRELLTTAKIILYP